MLVALGFLGFDSDVCQKILNNTVMPQKSIALIVLVVEKHNEYTPALLHHNILYYLESFWRLTSKFHKIGHPIEAVQSTGQVLLSMT